MKTRIGVPTHSSSLPLRRWLGQTSAFELHRGSIPEIAAKLRRRDLEAAFVSPIEYARESSEYRILPGFALSSRSGIILHFQEGLKRITSMAANPADASEIVLARIVLAEEFETSPPIVPLTETHLAGLLKRADSALLTGDACFLQETDAYHSLDIAEAWSEMVDLPYVHGVLCAREGAVPVEAVLELASHKWSMERATVTEADLPADPGGSETVRQATAHLRRYSFALDEESEEGLIEFLRYAHYHGMIPDIPAFQSYPMGDEADNEN